MVVGGIVRGSTPDGLLSGVAGFSLASFSIDPGFNHISLMYKINNDTSWLNCRKSCEIATDGVSQCIDLTLVINNLDLTDDLGAPAIGSIFYQSF